jgi:hypothetical protein
VKTALLSITMFLVLASTLSAQVGAKEISAEEAVQLAQRHVAEQGYTLAPPLVEKFRPEVNESVPLGGDLEIMPGEDMDTWESDYRGTILGQRHGTLNSQAYSVIHGWPNRVPTKDRLVNNGWAVVFRCRRPCLDGGEEYGRVVTMYADGGNVNLQLLKVKLSSVRKQNLEL